MIWGDGGECIVGVKAEVEKNSISSGGSRDWIETNVEVSGQRDDDAFLGMTVTESLLVPGSGVLERLVLGERFHWKIFVDVCFFLPPSYFDFACSCGMLIRSSGGIDITINTPVITPCYPSHTHDIPCPSQHLPAEIGL